MSSSLVKNLFSHVGSVASLIGLIIATKSPEQNYNGFHWLLIFFSAALFIISIYWIIKEYLSSKSMIFSNKTEIRNYLFEWIKNGSRVVIFTRDMSWVCDDDMRNMLITKSRNNECTICLPKKINKVEEFENNGATIIEYPSIDYVPLSRFTITNFGKDDAKIAVGKSIKNGKHLIEEFGNGEHPFFQVANDLVKILEKSTK